jgi:ABC-type nitrate/sulfonate/bicarbonate transport system permease component
MRFVKPLAHRKLLKVLLFLAVAGIFSEIAYLIFPKYDLFLPRPRTLLSSLSNDFTLFIISSAYTGSRILLGLLLGIFAATSLALIAALFPTVRPSLERWTMWSQTMPVPLFSPLLGLLFGYNLVSAAVVTALICFFPVYLGWQQGRLALARDVSLLAMSYQPRRIKYIVYILMPAALPYALIGVKGAVNLAVLGAVIAEFSAAGPGLGMLMLKGIRELDPAKSWGAMFILMLFAASMTALVNRLQHSQFFSYMGVMHEHPELP